MAYATFKDKSRVDYGREFCGNASQNVTWQEVRDGCLMRIADATELMAKNHAQLISERDRYERWYRQEKDSAKALRRTIAGLKGAITRLKKED